MLAAVRGECDRPAVRAQGGGHVAPLPGREAGEARLAGGVGEEVRVPVLLDGQYHHVVLFCDRERGYDGWERFDRRGGGGEGSGSCGLAAAAEGGEENQ